MPGGAASPERRGIPRRPATIAIGVAVAALSLFVAWQVVAVAQSRRLAATAPEEALAWRPNDPKALAYLAEREFTGSATSGGATDEADQHARKALRAGPLDVRALRVLAWVADDRGELDRARRLMTLAGARSQRDVSSHLWLFHDRLRAKAFDDAFAHGDALMRHAATQREAAVLMAAAAGADDRAAKALSARLARGPEWRAAFVRELTSSQDPDVSLAILLAVKEAGSEILPAESSALASRLVADGQAQEGYLGWVLLLPKDGYDVLGNVYNGTFEGPPGAGPFAWTFPRRADADIGVGAPGRGGKVLTARFSGTGKPVLARQMTVLAPGVYRLSVDVLVDLHAGGDMNWVVSCAGERRTELVAVPVPDRGRDWQPMAATFAVPADCPAQRLELRALGKGGRSPISARFDDLKIEPVAG